MLYRVHLAMNEIYEEMKNAIKVMLLNFYFKQVFLLLRNIINVFLVQLYMYTNLCFFLIFIATIS